MNEVRQIISRLRQKRLTIALAESITAGYASYLLTMVPGASAVFKGSLVAYSMGAKQTFFGIAPQLLRKTQGVSAEIALILAKKIRKLLKADIGGSVVGFAGPSARKGTKPGTIYAAVATAKCTVVKKYTLQGSRDAVRKKAAKLLIGLIEARL